MTASTSRRPGSRGLLRFGISIAVSAALVAYLLREIDPAQILGTLRAAHLPGVLAGTAAFLTMSLARVLRYRVLLETRVGLAPLTAITFVRGMLGDLLPARLGTLSYVYLVTTRTAVPLDQALASFLLALVLDMVVIAPMLLIALVAVGGGAGAGTLAALALALLAISVVATLLLAPGMRFVAGPIERVLPGAQDPDHWTAKFPETLRDTATRVDAVRARGALLPALGLSFFVRLGKFGSYWLFLQAVLVPLGVAWGSIDFFTGFLGVAGAELSAMLPISGIAAIGTWEAAFTIGFTRLGLTEPQAVLSGFATHILSQLHDYALGITALLWLMWPRRRPAEGRRGTARP